MAKIEYAVADEAAARELFAKLEAIEGSFKGKFGAEIAMKGEGNVFLEIHIKDKHLTAFQEATKDIDGGEAGKTAPLVPTPLSPPPAKAAKALPTPPVAPVSAVAQPAKVGTPPINPIARVTRADLTSETQKITTRAAVSAAAIAADGPQNPKLGEEGPNALISAETGGKALS